MSMATKTFTPRFTAVIVVYPPIIMNSPWARLMTFIMPNTTASPALIKTSDATP